MATDNKLRPTQPLTSPQLDEPVYSDASREGQTHDILNGVSQDHTLSDQVAAATSTPEEATIDARMGLHGAKGRTPRPEDFTDVLSPEGNSGDIVGSDISDSPFTFGEDGSTRIP